MWLLRGLSFTCKALQNSQSNKAQELSVAFTSSYEGTLKKFHGILIRPIFTVSCIAPPHFFVSFQSINGIFSTSVDLVQPFFFLGYIPVVVCYV